MKNNEKKKKEKDLPITSINVIFPFCQFGDVKKSEKRIAKTVLTSATVTTIAVQRKEIFPKTVFTVKKNKSLCIFRF